MNQRAQDGLRVRPGRRVIKIRVRTDLYFYEFLEWVRGNARPRVSCVHGWQYASTWALPSPHDALRHSGGATGKSFNPQAGKPALRSLFSQVRRPKEAWHAGIGYLWP